MSGGDLLVWGFPGARYFGKGSGVVEAGPVLEDVVVAEFFACAVQFGVHPVVEGIGPADHAAEALEQPYPVIASLDVGALVNQNLFEFRGADCLQLGERQKNGGIPCPDHHGGGDLLGCMNSGTTFHVEVIDRTFQDFRGCPLVDGRGMADDLSQSPPADHPS